MKKHIMAIGAHIGDAELTCGKTLATHALRGDTITFVGVTAGERGAPPDRDVEEFRQYNIDCAGSFAKALGGNFYCMGYPDGEIPDNDEFKYALCDLIRTHKPDVILTHWLRGIHRDHCVVARVMEEAIYYASLRGFERESADGTPLATHWARGPYYAENWEDADGFEPYIYIDVSPGYALWEEHIQKLWLTNNSPWFKYFTYYDALSRSRGALVHKERAECFAVTPHSKRLVLEGL